MKILPILLLALIISTSLVSAAIAKGTFTITQEEAAKSAEQPLLSPDEGDNTTEQTQLSPEGTESGFFAAIKNFFKAFFNLFKAK